MTEAGVLDESLQFQVMIDQHRPIVHPLVNVFAGPKRFQIGVSEGSVGTICTDFVTPPLAALEAPALPSFNAWPRSGGERMAPEEVPFAPVNLTDLIEAFEFVSVSELDEHQAYVCKRTGRIIFVSDRVDLEEGAELPDDPDAGKYHVVPHRRDLDLGRHLALAFVANEIPQSLNDARDIFRRKGAYSRFKRLLQAHAILEKWYAFEERAIEEALKEWCDEVGLTPAENENRA